MLETPIRLGPINTTAYTFYVAMALTVAGILVIARAEKGQRTKWLDVCIGALAGGLVFGRMFHVILSWEHFSYNTHEILQFSTGGLDWHGAVIGAMLGGFLGTRWRDVPFYRLLDALTPALPLIMLGAWFGCYAHECAYGAEVESLTGYPSFLVWEGQDIYGIYAPRFNPHPIAMLVAVALFLFVVFLFWQGWLKYRRFWLVLALVSMSMFGLGFLRGDYAVMITGLRADQWLDLVILGIGLFRLVYIPHTLTPGRNS